MTATTDFRRLLIASTMLVAVGLLAVVCSYQWIDRPVAYYVHDHGIDNIPLFKWLTYPPPAIQTASPAILVLLAIRRVLGPLKPWQRAVLVACVTLIVANQFRVTLGGLCGRYWPETWFHIAPARLPGGTLGNDLLAAGQGEYLNNPSLIGDGTYGFHPFHWSDDLGSFPSGHATRILSLATVCWQMMRRSRILCLLSCPPMLVSLVAMNYHFVSDVIAGSVVGMVVAWYAIQLAAHVAGERSDSDALA